MIVILITIILALSGLCALSGEDLLHKTEHTAVAWFIVIFLLTSCISVIFMFRDEIRRETIIKYERGIYKLETEIHCDTTYFVKRCKD